MRSYPVFAVLFVCIFLFSGCEQNPYQIIVGNDGTMYRVNKKTGDLSVVEDKKVVSLPETFKRTGVKKTAEQPLDKPIDWKESQYPGKDLKVRLETIWRENKLCYKFAVYPYKSLERVFLKRKQDYVYSIMKQGFTLELVDTNGFIIKQIVINLWDMTKIVDEKGNPKTLVMNAQVDCGKQSYKSIGGYTIKWLLEPELIDDENITSSRIPDATGKKK